MSGAWMNLRVRTCLSFDKHKVDVKGKRIFMRVDFNVPQDLWGGFGSVKPVDAGRTSLTPPRSPTLSALMVLFPPSRRRFTDRTRFPFAWELPL